MSSSSPQTRGRLGFLPESNYHALLERLAEVGTSSRTDLARDLGLSAASVGRIADRLLTSNLIVEGERRAAGVGRPQTLLHVNPTVGLVAGVSIRAGSMRLRLTDLNGNAVARKRVDRTEDGAPALASQLHALVREACETAPDVQLASLVVGISGVWNPVERQVYAAPNLSVLEGLDIQQMFEEAFGDDLLPGALQVDNDINFAALGEMEGGSAQGVNDFFYLSLGSGVGGAAVVGGSPYRGLHGFAGEIGYLPVHTAEGIQKLEDVLGRRALEEYAKRMGFDAARGDVFEYLASHEQEQEEVARFVSEVLGQALVSVVTTLNPPLIVLGGGVGRYGEVWIERIRERLAQFVPVVPRIVSTALGREASLLGAVGMGRLAARRALLNRELTIS